MGATVHYRPLTEMDFLLAILSANTCMYTGLWVMGRYFGAGSCRVRVLGKTPTYYTLISMYRITF